MKYKLSYAVLDHQGQMKMQGTCKEIAEKMQMNKKSIHNAIYNDKSLKGYIFLSQEQAKEFSNLTSLLEFCRSMDRRWLDTDANGNPVYRNNAKDCENTKIKGKFAENHFSESQLLKAEKNYRNAH